MPNWHVCAWPTDHLTSLEWKQIISALRTVGYDYVISIEHEDGLASPDEGLRKAVEVLQEAILSEPVGSSWWT